MLFENYYDTFPSDLRRRFCIYFLNNYTLPPNSPSTILSTIRNVEFMQINKKIYISYLISRGDIESFLWLHLFYIKIVFIFSPCFFTLKMIRRSFVYEKSVWFSWLIQFTFAFVCWKKIVFTPVLTGRHVFGLVLGKGKWRGSVHPVPLPSNW